MICVNANNQQKLYDNLNTVNPFSHLQMTTNTIVSLTLLKANCVRLMIIHKPESNGTPVAGIQEFPAKKFPTVNFPASTGLRIT